MTDTEILSEMMKDAALKQTGEKHGRPLVTLCEGQAPDAEVTIHNIPEDAVIIKADAFPPPDAVFNGGKGECCRADYIIISEKKKCILYIELKRTHDDWNRIIKQLLGAQCFLNYCREIGKSFWDDGGFLQNYKNRFVSIGHIGKLKRQPRYSISECNDAPEKAMRVDWANSIQFNRIARINA